MFLLHLRKLKQEDAELMLEWMMDENIIKNLQANFSEMTIQDCYNFILNSQDDHFNLHMAIANENNQYMGTVSLKNIDKQGGSAEFAIVLRKCAMGKGYSQYGMNTIISLGLTDLGLKQIVWCVSKENLRANKFYQKMGYELLEEVSLYYQSLYKNWADMNWYLAKEKC